MNIYRLAPIGLILVAPMAHAVYPTGTGTLYTTTIDAATYGTTGTIEFRDWGYTGPAGANEFSVGSGFDAGNVGQVQTVVTYGVNSSGVSNLDGLTPDPAKAIVKSEDNAINYTNASMDGQVNFYKWGFTTPSNSTFTDMQIDKNGNYFVERNNMAFGFYDYFAYHDTTGTNPDQMVDTNINFQPYAISDGRGWCGSTLATNPNGLQQMAGQLTFDFAFDAYFGDGVHDPVNGGGTQVVPDFVMRSYGDYVITVNGANAAQTALTTYRGSAVINNTNPLTGELDPAYQNQVSFLGGGVVPLGVWVTGDSYNGDGTRVLNADGTWQVTVARNLAYGTTTTCTPGAAVRADGARCHQNSFSTYGFLLRADGTRQLTWLNPTGHSNYNGTDAEAYTSIGQAVPAVPVPAAAWLFGSGLMGLVAVARRRRSA